MDPIERHFINVIHSTHGMINRPMTFQDWAPLIVAGWYAKDLES